LFHVFITTHHTSHFMLNRRRLIGLPMASWVIGQLSACQRSEKTSPQSNQITGSYTYENHSRGHFLRNLSTDTAIIPSKTIRTACIIAGGGVAGLSAARGLRLASRPDFVLLELADEAGGNARAGTMQGIVHPLGAHYLPAPSHDAGNVQALLEELGICQRISGRWVYDEQLICHSPQERLFFQNQWQEGLLPLQGVSNATLAQYQQFSTLVDSWKKAGVFHIPKHPTARPHQDLLALHTLSFSAYLNQYGLNDVHLLWYLDYCCRDDYGAGLGIVSAWAGIHYFAARHGFNNPHSQRDWRDTEKSSVLTWPQGNAYLTQALANPLVINEQIRIQRVIVRIETLRDKVVVDAMNMANQQWERYEAPTAIIALPAFVAAKVLVNPPHAISQRAKAIQYSAWSVANVLCNAPLRTDIRTAGTAPEMAWDNVIYSGISPDKHTSLGYVNATHQTAGQWPQATVLTHYSAYGTRLSSRQALLTKPWQQARDEVLRDLSQVHGDIYEQVKTVNITRYGHAMAVPVVRNTRELPALLQQPILPRVRFAHSDWAGYSVFEEAFEQGAQAVDV
jgi:protoporphyrinogen oxidase